MKLSTEELIKYAEEKVKNMSLVIDQSAFTNIKGELIKELQLAQVGLDALRETQGVPGSIAMQNVKDIAHCLSDIRRFVEAKFMTVGDLPSPEGLLLSGLEWKHESDAIIAALNRVADFYESQSHHAEIGYEEAYALSPNNDRPDITHGFKFGWNACVKSLFTTPHLPVELKVWYGSMPESNGKSNWTAILHRQGDCISDGIIIERSEYSDRVRYEADRVRYIIGESAERPSITSYDPDRHSGYVSPKPSLPRQEEITTTQAHLSMRSTSLAGCYRDGWNDCIAAAAKPVDQSKALTAAPPIVDDITQINDRLAGKHKIYSHPINRTHLEKYVRGLNTKHNVDENDVGAVSVRRQMNDTAHHQFRAEIKGVTGPIILTRMGTARVVVEELRSKDWRQILLVAKAERIPHNRRLPGKA